MKLLYCTKCRAIFNLSREVKYCTCGETNGRYTDELNAEYHGPAIPLGFTNFLFSLALSNQPDEGLGENFEAFVIPKNCPTFRKTDGN